VATFTQPHRRAVLYSLAPFPFLSFFARSRRISPFSFPSEIALRKVRHGTLFHPRCVLKADDSFSAGLKWMRKVSLSPFWQTPADFRFPPPSCRGKWYGRKALTSRSGHSFFSFVSAGLTPLYLWLIWEGTYEDEGPISPSPLSDVEVHPP